MAENLLPFIMNCSQQHGDIEGAAGAAPPIEEIFFSIAYFYILKRPYFVGGGAVQILSID